MSIPKDYALKPLPKGFKVRTNFGLALQVKGHKSKLGKQGIPSVVPFHLSILSPCHNARLIDRPNETYWVCSVCYGLSAFSKEKHPYLSMQHYINPGDEAQRVEDFLTKLVPSLSDTFTSIMATLELQALINLLFEELYSSITKDEKFTRAVCDKTLRKFYGEH